MVLGAIAETAADAEAWTDMGNSLSWILIGTGAYLIFMSFINVTEGFVSKLFLKFFIFVCGIANIVVAAIMNGWIKV